MKKIIIIFLFSSCFCKIAAAQNSVMTPADYIAQYKDIAMREEKRMGIPAAISLAQGILETECGNSELVKKSNNHFGIKCKGTWTAGSVAHDDDAPGECFRVYKTAEDSYRDHSNFLRGNDRYSFLFKFDPRNYKAWAYGLKKAGYATNPHYPDILIKNIEDNNLEQYTLLAVNDMPHFDASKYASDPEDKDAGDVMKTTGQKDDSLTAPLKLTINGCNALMVPKGTSLLAVATQNNINLNRLLEINDLKQDGLLDKDQYIFLEKKKKEGSSNYYIVQEGETLFDIAQKNGIVLQSLCTYNNVVADDTIAIGTKLLLKPAPANATKYAKQYIPSKREKENAAETVPAEHTIHIVQPKESLYGIAKKYNVSIDELKEWNHLPDDNLKVGQLLTVSK